MMKNNKFGQYVNNLKAVDPAQQRAGEDQPQLPVGHQKEPDVVKGS